jgi:uncharacterized protein YeaO (DUF488 family)
MTVLISRVEAMLRIKRIYEPPSKKDGRRILVDRVWPRGFTKEKASVDEWRKDLAPSDSLRKWFGHDPKKWEEFRERYRRQLQKEGKGSDLKAIAQRAKRENVTLVFSAKDEEHNQAVALKEVIEGWRPRRTEEE